MLTFAQIEEWFTRVVLLDTTKSTTTKVPAQVPKPGEVWALGDGSPWPVVGRGATILDVKDGWVRYSLGGRHSDERMEQRYFVKIYKK
jgi:hypothetical protein